MRVWCGLLDVGRVCPRAATQAFEYLCLTLHTREGSLRQLKKKKEAFKRSR